MSESTLKAQMIIETNLKESLASILKFRRAAGKELKGLGNVIDEEFGEIPKLGVSSFKKMFDDLKKTSSRLGLNPFKFEKIEKKFDKQYAKMEATEKKLDKYRAKLKKSESEDDKEKYKKKIEFQKHIMRKEGRNISDLLGHEKKLLETRKQNLSDYHKIRQKKGSEHVESLGRNAASMFNDLKSQNIGMFADIFKGGGKALAMRGARLQEKFAGGTGIRAKGANMMGDMMSSMGPLLAGLGGVVAGFTAVAGIVMAVDSHTKGLNKTLIQSGVTAADLAGNYMDFEDSLNRVTALTGGAGGKAEEFRQTWNLTAEAQMQLVGAFNQGNMAFKKFSNNADGTSSSIGSIQENMETALTYANLFSVAAPEMVATQSKMMTEWGMSLDEVKEQFGSIFEAARQSTYGVKNFYSMVLNVTSGLASYNVRMSETAALLLKLSKVMDPGRASAFLQAISGKYEKMGIKDRFTDVKKRGAGLTKEILVGKEGIGGVGRVEDLKKKYGHALQSSSDRVGVKIDWSKGSEEIMKQLSKLTTKQEGMLVQGLQRDLGGGDKGTAAAEELMAAAQISGAMSGSAKDLAMAMDAVSAGQELALELTGMQKLVGGKSMAEAMDKFETRALMEETYGAEQAKRLREVSLRLEGNFDILQKESARMKELTELAKLEGPRGEEAKKELEELKSRQDQNAKSMGGMVKDNGDIVSTTIDENGDVQEGGTMNKVLDYMMTNGAELEKASLDKQSQQLDVSKQIVENTKDIADTLKIGIEALMRDMYSWMKPIWDGMGIVWDGIKGFLSMAVEGIIDLVDRFGGKGTAARLSKNFKSAVLGPLGYDSDLGFADQNRDTLTEEEEREKAAFLEKKRTEIQAMKVKETSAEKEVQTLSSELRGMGKGTPAEEAAYKAKEKELEAAQKRKETYSSHGRALAGQLSGVQNLTGGGIQVSLAETGWEGFQGQEMLALWDTAVSSMSGEEKKKYDSIKHFSGEDRNKIALAETDNERKALIDEIFRSQNDGGKWTVAGAATAQARGETGIGADVISNSAVSQAEGRGLLQASEEGVSSEDLPKFMAKYMSDFLKDSLDSNIKFLGEGITKTDEDIAAQQERVDSAALTQDSDLFVEEQRKLEELQNKKKKFEEQLASKQAIQIAEELWKKEKQGDADAFLSMLGFSPEQISEMSDDMAAALADPKAQKKFMKGAEGAKVRTAVEMASSDPIWLEELKAYPEFLNMVTGGGRSRSASLEGSPEVTDERSASEANAAAKEKDRARARDAEAREGANRERDAKAAKEAAALRGPSLKDFIWRPGQAPVSFSPNDELFGAKSGGPIEKLLGGGGGGAVNINIYGDEAKVYQVVKRVLSELKMI